MSLRYGGKQQRRSQILTSGVGSGLRPSPACARAKYINGIARLCKIFFLTHETLFHVTVCNGLMPVDEYSALDSQKTYLILLPETDSAVSLAPCLAEFYTSPSVVHKLLGYLWLSVKG